MYTSSSLSPLSILLAELSVSDSSPLLTATSAENSCWRDACGGGNGDVMFLRYIRDSASTVPVILQVSYAHLQTVSH